MNMQKCDICGNEVSYPRMGVTKDANNLSPDLRATTRDFVWCCIRCKMKIESERTNK